METNRVEKGLRDWSNKEAMLKDLFGPGIQHTHYMAKAKLVTYREINDSVHINLSSDEKLMKGVLRGEIRVLERQLFPNTIIRIARSLGRLLNRANKAESLTKATATLVIQPIKRNIHAAMTKQTPKPIQKRQAPTGLLEKKKSILGKAKSIYR